MDELELKWPDIFARLKPYKKKFVVSNAAMYSVEVRDEIAEVRRQHPKLYDPAGLGNPADPF